MQSVMQPVTRWRGRGPGKHFPPLWPGRPTRSVFTRVTAGALAVLAGWLSSLALAGPSLAAGPSNRPNFLMPFTCNERWQLTTYLGHSPDDKKIDMYRVGGATSGSAARASAAGLVHEWFDPGGLEIDHGGGWFTVYLHMSSRIAVGSRVNQGDWIGTVGSVGTSAAHLHYEQLYDVNGDHDGETDEMVNSVIQGVEYHLSPAGPFPTVTSLNGCGGTPAPVPQPRPAHGCPAGYVCYYPQNAGWNGDRPSVKYYRYGSYNLSEQYGTHRLFNNQTDGAKAYTCTGWNGGGTCTRLDAGQWADRNITPVNSIKLTP
jgi:hypothetical protein